MERIQLTIDRARWGRGNPPGILLNGDRTKMCCLGFLAKAVGASDDQIYLRSTPGKTKTIAWPEGIAATGQCPVQGCQEIHNEATLTSDLMGVNDCVLGGRISSIGPKNGTTIVTEGQRESLVTQLMAQAGIDVTFVDGAAEPTEVTP